MINEKTTAGVLYIDNEAYTISSDIQYSSISNAKIQHPQIGLSFIFIWHLENARKWLCKVLQVNFLHTLKTFNKNDTIC